jgi:glycosyltransferase involved in cell wall biosynthesis
MSFLYLEDGGVLFEHGCFPEILKPKEDSENFTSNKINPKVSIITPSFNQGCYLEENILSVARQSVKDFEHIIVDNLSTDNTNEIVEKYPHVTFVSEKDRGVMEAIVKGLFISKGEYVMIIPTSDGILDQNYLSKCIHIMDSDKEISMVWSLVQYIDSGILRNSIHLPEFWDRNNVEYIDCPQKEDWFDYWKRKKLWGFEITMVVRRDVFIECYTQSVIECLYSKYTENKNILDFLEFFIFFNKKRYFPYFLKQISCFARQHENSVGDSFDWSEIVNNYYNRIDTL